MHKQIKVKRIITTLVALAGICLCVFIGYKLYLLRESYYGHYPRGLSGSRSSYSLTVEFEIAPETMLLSLEQGEIDLFKPIIATPEVYTRLPAGSFPWTQSDYLNIANALEQFKSKENLNDWYVYSMLFEKDCGDNPKGFDSGEITYFKTDNGASDYYVVNAIVIYPLFKQVTWGGSSFPRPLFGWTSINLNSLKITADDALQMAEEKGGKEARLKVKNECKISIINNGNPGRDDDDWDVWYSLYSNVPVDNVKTDLFEIHIDPYSGRYKIIDTNK